MTDPIWLTKITTGGFDIVYGPCPKCGGLFGSAFHVCWHAKLEDDMPEDREEVANFRAEEMP